MADATSGGSDAMAIDAAVDARSIDAAIDAAPQTLDPSLSSLTTDRDVATAGVDTVTITVTLRDTANQPIAGATVGIAVTGSGNVLTTAPPTDANGATTAALTSSVAESKQITANVASTTIGTHVVMFVPGPATQLAFLDPPSTVVAGAKFTPVIRVAAEDASGNIVTTATGLVALDLASNPGSSQIGGASSASLASGVVSFADAHIDVAANGYAIRASSTGLTAVTSGAFNVTPGTPDAAHSWLEAAPATVEADGVASARLTAHIANTYGAAIANAPVNFAVTGSNNMLVPTATTTSSIGNATAWLRSTTVETKTVTATVSVFFTLSAPVQFRAPGCEPQLPAPPWSTLDQTPDAVLVTDLDGDGHQDFVISLGTTIAVYRGHGDGTFFPPFVFSTPSPTDLSEIVAGDVNGDGRLDLVMNEANDGAIDVALGVGGGQFATAQTVPFSAPSRGVALGDIDNDGKLDIVASFFSWGQIQTFIGAGDGTFTMGLTIASSSATALTLADTNHDGKLDLISDDSANLSVALGDGIGGFGTPHAYTEPGGAGGPMFVADLNHDGHVDVLMTGSDSVSVMLGAGNGTFHAAGGLVWLASNLYDDNDYSTVDGVGFADLDGDGDLDVVAESGGALSILTNAGDGTLTLAPRAFQGGGQGMAYADLDEDGIGDVLALGPHAFGLIHGEPGATFNAADVYPRRDGRMYPLAGDFDGNGQLDVLRSTSFEGFIVGLTNANGSITDAPAANAGGGDSVPVVEDATGDGKLDLVSLGVIFPGRGDGTFQAPIVHTVSVSRKITGGTFGPDNRADLVLTPSFGTGFWIAQTQPDYSVALSSMYASATNWVVTGDVNNDGFSDVLTTDANGDLAVYLGNGLGGVSQPVSYPTHGLTGILELGDVDGDSFLDAVFFSNDPVSHVVSTIVLRGLGNGAFGPPLVTPGIAFPADTLMEDVQLADFTGDGALDLAVSTDRGFAIVGGFGDGYFRQHVWYYGLAWYTTDSTTPSVVVSDRNRDGLPDVTFWSHPGYVVGLNAGCAP